MNYESFLTIFCTIKIITTKSIFSFISIYQYQYLNLRYNLLKWLEKHCSNLISYLINIHRSPLSNFFTPFLNNFMMQEMNEINNKRCGFKQWSISVIEVKTEINLKSNLRHSMGYASIFVVLSLSILLFWMSFHCADQEPILLFQDNWPNGTYHGEINCEFNVTWIE